MAEGVFWFCALFVGYAYAGYPLLLLLWPARRKVARAPIQPRISFVVAAWNEGERLVAKLDHLLAADYPEELREVVVVSDGSTDDTADRLAPYRNRVDVQIVLGGTHRGKAHALNQGVAVAQGEIVVFTDVRQTIPPGSLRTLMENFADAATGAAGGELRFVSEDQPKRKATMYWKLERWIRHRESLIGSSMGLTGAYYAIRRELFRPLPDGLILDDVYTPLQIAMRGWRVTHDQRAAAYDVESDNDAQEFRRKVRTLTGNYQLVRLLPGLLSPGRVGLQFFSHKLARLLAPLCLPALLIANLFLDGWMYRLALTGQLVFYGLAVVGMLLPHGLPSVLGLPQVFLLLNGAAVFALAHFLRGDTNVWKR